MKSRSRSFLPSFIKKSSITGLTAVLTWILYSLAGDLSSVEQPLKLPSSKEPIQIYSNQTNDNLTQVYIKSIEKAKVSIHLVIYALLDDKIIAALEKKTAEKIPVYIVCDAKASPGITRKLPNATIIRRISEGLVHQKILVIDEKECILGSANLTYSSLNTHGNLVCGVINNALSKLMVDRIKKMDDEGNVLPPLKREVQAGGQKLELWTLPNDPEAVNKMISLFRCAKKTIKVAMFTWTRTDFTEELIAAAKRGVKVETVLDRYSGKGASAKIVQMLQSKKIPVFLSTGKGLLHHKFVYIDDSILVNGSANWTSAAFKSNDDCFVVISPLNTEQQQKMNALWSVIKQQSSKPCANSKEETKKNPKVEL